MIISLKKWLKKDLEIDTRHINATAITKTEEKLGLDGKKAVNVIDIDKPGVLGSIIKFNVNVFMSNPHLVVGLEFQTLEEAMEFRAHVYGLKGVKS